MAQYLITQYSGSVRRAPEQVDGDPDHSRIILVKDDGTTQMIFQGSKFSQEKFIQDMKEVGQRPWLEKIKV